MRAQGVLSNPLMKQACMCPCYTRRKLVFPTVAVFLHSSLFAQFLSISSDHGFYIKWLLRNPCALVASLPFGLAVDVDKSIEVI